MMESNQNTKSNGIGKKTESKSAKQPFSSQVYQFYFAVRELYIRTGCHEQSQKKGNNVLPISGITLIYDALIPECLLETMRLHAMDINE